MAAITIPSRPLLPRLPPTSLLIPLIVLCFISSATQLVQVQAFSAIQPATRRCRIAPLLRATGFGSSDDVSSSSSKKKNTKGKKKGDSLRDATGIRPSLHPTTINCVAEALLLRSQGVLGKTKDGEAIAIDTANPDVEPLQAAISAGGIAMAAIDRRNEVAKTDETTDVFTPEESQTISGRVVGVVMRLRDLESLLVQRVNGVGWVRKYGEEESFGALAKECRTAEEEETEEGERSPSGREELEKQLAETIETNPLFRMNRAECLLALFLSTVEAPKLEMLGEGVAGGSRVDFIDADRIEVLLLEPKDAFQ